MPARLLPLLVALALTACSPAPAARSAAAPTRPAASDAVATARPGAGATGATTPSPDVLQPSESFSRTEIVFVDGDRRVAMPVLVADTPELRTTGLMGRTALPEDMGMLFVFDDESRSPFWMKDTLLPLTIAYVGEDGTVQQLTDMDPCTADPCPRYPADQPYRYAVEANQGFYERHGITPGWTLELPDAIGGTA